MVAKSLNIMYTRVKEKGACCGCACVENQRRAYINLPDRLPSAIAPKWTTNNIVVSSKMDCGNRNMVVGLSSSSRNYIIKSQLKGPFANL